MMDHRLPEDTLFWIMEEDFRFWPPGEDPDGADDYTPAFAELVTTWSARPKSCLQPKSAPKRQGRSLAGASTNEEEGRAYRPPRVCTEFHEALPRGNSRPDDPNDGFSQDVADMVRIATMCSRAGWGDLIWVTWVPNKQKPTRIGHGTMCLLMTKDGMKAIKSATSRGVLHRGHIDLELQRWLRVAGEAERAQACYLYPPIGSYTEHPSECDPKQFGGDKTRKSGFFSGENPCHGTRQASDPKQRVKCMYQWRGSSWKDRVCEAFPPDNILHTAEFFWISCEFVSGKGIPKRKGKERGAKGTNPGKTEREKRAYRAFWKRMENRCWVEPGPGVKARCLPGTLTPATKTAQQMGTRAYRSVFNNCPLVQYRHEIRTVCQWSLWKMAGVLSLCVPITKEVPIANFPLEIPVRTSHSKFQLGAARATRQMCSSTATGSRSCMSPMRRRSVFFIMPASIRRQR